MPQIPTYIRQADWDKYIAIQSSGGWPEFIHNALNENKLTGIPLEGTREYDRRIHGKPIKKPTGIFKGDKLVKEIKIGDIPILPKSSMFDRSQNKPIPKKGKK